MTPSAMQLDTILYPTDFSATSKAALSQAVFLANQYNADLHLLHVIVLHSDDPLNPEYHFPESEEIYAELRKVAQSEMSRLFQEGQGKSLKIREHMVRALSAGPAILEKADELDADLIVMGSHGRRGVRRLFLGSVAEEVVRSATCPVLTVHRPEDEERAPLERIRRIVAPVDFSEESAAALAAARELATAYDSVLEVVHVVEHPTFTRRYEPVYNRAEQYSFPQAASRVEAALGEFLDEVSEGEGGGPETHLRVLEGNPAAAIVDFVGESDAGLVVMATHGLTGLEHFLLGSVTERVVRTAPCPVLTLKPGAGAADDADDEG